jgi:Lecithin retinol acyltransferase
VYGDQLRVKREFLGLVPIWHHALELPGGQVAENGPYGTRITDFDAFAKDGPLARSGPVEVVARDMTTAERDAAVERAWSRVGEHAYDVFTWNCEHFATWCATGGQASVQVLQWLDRLAKAALAVAVAALFVSLRSA